MYSLPSENMIRLSIQIACFVFLRCTSQARLPSSEKAEQGKASHGQYGASDIRHGLGVTVRDPHGGLVEQVLEMIPRSRTNDVSTSDPYDVDARTGNQHPGGRGRKRSGRLLFSHLLSIFKAFWADSWGPRMEDILRKRLICLIEQPRPQSILAIPKLLMTRIIERQILRTFRTQPCELFSCL